MIKGPLMPPHASRGPNREAPKPLAEVAADTSLEYLSVPSPSAGNASQHLPIHTRASVMARFGSNVQIGDTTIHMELAA